MFYKITKFNVAMYSLKSWFCRCFGKMGAGGVTVGLQAYILLAIVKDYQHILLFECIDLTLISTFYWRSCSQMW